MALPALRRAPFGAQPRDEPLSRHASYVLSNGTITAATVMLLENPNPVVAAITGGTGASAGARGTLTPHATGPTP